VLQCARLPSSAWRKGTWLLAIVLGLTGGAVPLHMDRGRNEHQQPTETSTPRKRPALSVPVNQATYAHLPLFFEANHGQADPAVQFLARDRNAILFLTATEAVLALRQGLGPALLLVVIGGAVGAWWWARGIGKQTGT
jgi:hypothetical protein